MSMKKKHEQKAQTGSGANDGDNNNACIESDSLISLHCN
jgi:hypothetical protein